MSERIVLLTESDHAVLVALVEWARNSRGIGLINTPWSLTTSPRRRGRRSRGGVKFRWCTVVTVHDDHLDCRPVDGPYPESSFADFTVAKPSELRKTLTDGLTIPNQEGVLIEDTYPQHVSTSRTASDDEGDEEQVIVPAYVPAQTTDDGVFHPGSLILAISVADTRVTYAGANGQTIAVTWLDMNINGRAWAENDE